MDRDDPTTENPIARRQAGERRPLPALLSVVVPAFNEAALIADLLDRLRRTLDEIAVPFEVIVVDDRSTDATFAILTRLRQDRPWLKTARFSRNFGKEIALAAGLNLARGDVVVQIDADLQHPPALIAAFLDAWRDGADLVYGARDRAAERSGLRDLLSRLFYRLFDQIAEVQLMPGSGDFALFDRKVVDVLNAMPERSRFGKGLYAWVGFNTHAVPYAPDPRAGGGSRWSLRRLLGLALDGITSFSVMPLRIWSVFGAIISLLSFAYGASIAFETIFWGADVPGYPSLMVGIAFLGGVQLVTLGVLGEYLGKVFMEVKRRPLYVLDEVAGFEAPPRTGQAPIDPPDDDRR